MGVFIRSRGQPKSCSSYKVVRRACKKALEFDGFFFGTTQMSFKGQ
jgi:hypothetical protein